MVSERTNVDQERDIHREYHEASGYDRERLEEELAQKHFKLVYMVVNRHRHFPFDTDELESAAAFGLFKAIRGFNPDLGFKFSSYAVRVMYNEIRLLLRKQQKHFSVPLDAKVSHDSDQTWAEHIADANAPEPAGQLILEGYQEALDDTTKLTKRERLILHMRMTKEMGQSDVAAELGVAQATVSRAEKRAKLKILNRFEQVGLVDGQELPENKKHPPEMVKLAEENGISYSVYKKRINEQGMDPHEAATTPLINRNFKDQAVPVIRKALLEGMTGREIRDKYFPGRKMTTINNYSAAVRRQLKAEGLL